MLKDYVGALQEFDKVDVFEPNNASTLMIHGDVKRNLQDYVGALEDLDKVDVLKPNNAFTLRTFDLVELSKGTRRIMLEPWRTLTRLIFFNQTMPSL
jgi:tetratricopeptide (TPR) repeat protein